MTNKTEYVLGEPVFLQLVLSNLTTDKVFEIYGHLHPANDLEVKIWRSGGIPRRYTMGLSDVIFPGISYTLTPRSLHGHRWMLCHERENASGFLFDRPGMYNISVRAQLTVNGLPQTVPFKMQIRVVEPPPAQKPAFDLIWNPQCAQDLQASKADASTLAIWEKLGRVHSRSVWAPYAAMLLSRAEWESEETDYEDVASRLTSLARSYPDFPMRDDVYYAAAGCEDRLGRPVQALRWLLRMMREYPKTPNADASKVLFRKYLAREGTEGRFTPWYLKP
jgi:hypothetical protein